MEEKSFEKIDGVISLAEFKKNMIDLLDELNDDNFDRMWQIMTALVNKIDRVESKNRNFDINVEEGEDELSVKLEREDGEVFDLAELLPAGYSFQSSDIYEMRIDAKEVAFPPEAVKYRGSLMSLFHEIGHTYADNPDPMDDVDDVIDFFKILGKSTFGGAGDGIGLLKAFRKMSRYPESKALEGPNVRKFITSERDAWAFALREMRKLEKKGFDVFADFESVDDIEGYIFSSLINYEMQRRVWHGEGDREDKFIRKNKK